MIISIDLSLRSSAICAISEERELIDFCLIKSQKKQDKKNIPVFNNEELLIYNSNQIVKFIENNMRYYAIDGIVIEGLSFGSISGSKDIIAGNSWVVRASLFKRFNNIPISIVPVSMWRGKTITKTEKDEAKKKYGPKTYLKEAVVDKLPVDVKEKFMDYIKSNKYNKDSLFDLADSYFLGVYQYLVKNE